MSTEERADELLRLERGICRCRKCPLHKGRHHAVPGEGDPDADVMLVGEAPGEKEDLSGRPFVGRSGGFLDKVLAELGMVREDLFITSCVKCRPPHNRTPCRDELGTCRDAWLTRQIACVQPHLVVLMGLAAVESVLGETVQMRQVHGQMRPYGDSRCLLTYHPTAAMRFPEIRKRFRADLSALKGL